MTEINNMPDVLDPERMVDAKSTPSKTSQAGKMSMARVNFWLDAALFLNILWIMWISVMLQLVFPPPTEASGWRLWGLSFNEWQRVQFFSLCVFALLAVEHVVLHWNWVCSVLATQILRLKNRPDEGEQAVYGVGTFIVILVLSMSTLIAAMFAAEQASL